MSISQKVRDMIADAHDHGYASELPESVQKVLHAIADHVDGLVHGAAPDLGPINSRLEEIAETLNKQTLDRIEQLGKGFEATLDERVKALFDQLLAKAAAADKPADPPVLTPAEPAPQA
jgi:hypothetical protein